MVTELEDLGDEIGVKIRCQREDIFTKMHRI
jgi:ACT domain-containing protein